MKSNFHPRNPKPATPNTKAILLAIFIVALPSLVLGADWNQYTPSPTINTIQDVAVTNNGRAMAYTDAGNILYYNGTGWLEVTPPTGITGLEVLDLEATRDNEIFWIWVNTTDDTSFKLYQYNQAIDTWSNILNYNVASLGSYNIEQSGTTGAKGSFFCQEKTGTGNKCYLTLGSTTSNDVSYFLGLIDETGNDINATTKIGYCNYNTLLDTQYITNIAYMAFEGTSNCLVRYNGVSFVSLGGVSGTTTDLKRFEMTSNNIGALADDGNDDITYFNSSTQTFSGIQCTNCLGSLPTIDTFAINSDTNRYYFFVSATGKIYRGTIGITTNLTSLTEDQTGLSGFTSADINDEGTLGFMVGSGGTIYQLGTGSTTTDESYSVSTTPSSNPSVYGTNTQFNTIITNTYGTTSNINITFSNATESNYYGWTFNNVIGSTSTSNSISGFLWTNFATGQTWNVTTTATDGSGHTSSSSFTWTINANSTTNTTNYTNTGYTATGYTNIVSVDNQGTNRLYAVGINGTDTILISYDISNPNNIITKSKLISGADIPTSISLSSNRGYLATAGGLYPINNTQSGDATQTTINNPVDYSLGSDYVYDVNAIDNELAWTCGQNNNLFVSDQAELFNYTNYDYQDTLSNTNPCLTTHYDNGITYIHKGTSGIRIYNYTALLSTISGIITQPSGATNDRISKYNNYLFAITGTTQITKYDISNLSSPVKVFDCNTNQEVYSLEALSENEIILGVDGGIRICDYANTENYDTITGKYFSTNLKTYLSGEIPYEVTRIDDNGKYAVAQGNSVGLYYFNKAIVETPTNNPPTITSITTSTNNACINQSVTMQIIASDVENDQLSYDYDCEGIKAIKTNNYASNQFTCTYTTAGTKTIKGWVEDPYNTEVLSTKSISVTSCNTTGFLEFQVLDGLDTNHPPISGVLVNVVGQTSGVTNEAGLASFQINTGTYTITFSKSGYLTETQDYETSNGVNVVYLEPTTGTEGQRNILTINVLDTNNQPISNAIVSVTDPITAISKVGSTNSIGSATFIDVTSGINLRISAGKTGYTTTFTETIINSGQTKTITITLPRTGEITNASSGRGCTDYIKGMILCSPLNISGNGDSCKQDSDCITGRCQLSGGGARTCSNFNYSICDEAGYDRGSFRCASVPFLKRGGQVISDSITDYLLYFLAFIVLIFLILLIIGKTTKK